MEKKTDKTADDGEPIILPMTGIFYLICVQTVNNILKVNIQALDVITLTQKNNSIVFQYKNVCFCFNMELYVRLLKGFKCDFHCLFCYWQNK